MEVLKDLEDETNPFLSSISVTDSNIEETGNEIFVLEEDKSKNKLIDIEGIWNNTCFLSNFFYFLFFCFFIPNVHGSYSYMEEK